MCLLLLTLILKTEIILLKYPIISGEFWSIFQMVALKFACSAGPKIQLDGNKFKFIKKDKINQLYRTALRNKILSNNLNKKSNNCRTKDLNYQNI